MYRDQLIRPCPSRACTSYFQPNVVGVADAARTSLWGEYLRIARTLLCRTLLWFRFGQSLFLPHIWSAPVLTKVGRPFDLWTVLLNRNILSYRGVGMANWQKIGSLWTTDQHVYWSTDYAGRPHRISDHWSVRFRLAKAGPNFMFGLPQMAPFGVFCARIIKSKISQLSFFSVFSIGRREMLSQFQVSHCSN